MKTLIDLNDSCRKCGIVGKACQCSPDIFDQSNQTKAEPLNDFAVGRSLTEIDSTVDDKDIGIVHQQMILAPVLREKDLISGRYEVVALLGRGGMGSVYKVKHSALGKFYALKILNHDVSSDVKGFRRFAQEAKASGYLEHKNLVSVHDYGADDAGVPFLVMDLMEGTELSKEIKEKNFLDESLVLELFAGIADGLSYAHERGIIHRDLKPIDVLPPLKGWDSLASDRRSINF